MVSEVHHEVHQAGCEELQAAGLDIDELYSGASWQPLSESHAVFPYLHRLSETPGWHFEDRLVVQVARNAKSFRSPVPRCDPLKFPFRSSYARFDRESGFSEWRILEEQVPVKELRSLQAPIGAVASVLFTVFRPLPTKEEDQLLKPSIGNGSISDIPH